MKIAVLARALRDVIDGDRRFMSPRVRRRKHALDEYSAEAQRLREAGAQTMGARGAPVAAQLCRRLGRAGQGRGEAGQAADLKLSTGPACCSDVLLSVEMCVGLAGAEA
jgi:hypothetical protein